MPFHVLALAAALTAQPPAPPDDPAIAVCELMVKQSLRWPGSFARTGPPAIEAATVTLAFQSLDARGRPVSDSRQCRFHLAPDGRYHLEPFRRSYLARRLATARARLPKAASANELALARSEILDIGREMFVQDGRMKAAERLAAQAGLYPIDPARTALRGK